VKTVCAWCGKDTGEKDGEGVEGTSHGICEECLEECLSKLEVEAENKISAGGEQDDWQVKIEDRGW